MRVSKKKLLGKASAKRPLRKASAKAQSAMEYLMTYGWAILIISVVLAALFQLGVFNPMTFAPKAPPGACQVFRPNGPYTTSFINLEGVCSGELPQYVAAFPGASNINTNNIVTATIPSISGSNVIFTITGWFNIPYINTNPQTDWMESFVSFSYQGAGIFNYTSCPTCTATMVLHRCTPADTCTTGVCGGQSSINSHITQTEGSILNKWNFFAFVSSPPNYYFQLNNQNATAINGNPTSWTGQVYIGGNNGCGDSPMVGELANIQIYNTSLTPAEIEELYLEGIGGAPIDLQHLVAWWPLNGNANDYSGNGNNGQINGNVNFVSNWYSGYTPP